MIVRNAMLTFLALLLLIAGGVWMIGVGSDWLMIAIGIAMVALLVERKRYWRRTGGKPGPEWFATGEWRIDPESGAVLRMWEDSATGERREVAGEPTLH